MSKFSVDSDNIPLQLFSAILKALEEVEKEYNGTKQ